MVQLACSAADTIMASNNCKSYRAIISSAISKVLCMMGTIVHFLNALLHFFNISNLGICKSRLLTFKNSETTCAGITGLLLTNVSAINRFAAKSSLYKISTRLCLKLFYS